MCGAEPTIACAAPPPSGLSGVLAGLTLSRGQPVRYREEVSHPALERPEIATGSMWIAEDGRLVRDQVTPERQRSEIGETMLLTRESPGSEPTLYPIPADARPMLAAIRGVLAGDAAAVPSGFETTVASGNAGWMLTLRPVAAGAVDEIRFTGCGGALRRMVIDESGGVTRTVTFAPGQ